QSAYSNSSARDVISKLMTQRSQYEGKAVQYAQSPGLDAASQLPRRDVGVALAGIDAQLKNLAAQQPVADAAAAVLDRIGKSIADYNELLAGKDNTAQKIGTTTAVGILGAGGAAAGVMGAKGLYQWFTGAGALTGSAAALDAAAANLTAAAFKIAGGSIPGV